MVEPTAGHGPQTPPAERQVLANRLGGVGWALVFIWIGVALLVEFAASVTLLGIGVITLGVQLARRSVGLSFEVFWLVVGFLFVLAGVWDVLGSPEVQLLPILLIVAGVVGLLSFFRR